MTIKGLVFLLPLLLLCLTTISAQEWKPVDQRELYLITPVVENGADAEVLLWEVYVDDSSRTTTDFNHYLRIKVFNERGKETQSRIDLRYSAGVQIKDISGRTVRTDGSIIELKKDAIFDRDLVKFGPNKIKAKSFIMQNVLRGSIIEYRWREVHEGGTNYIKLYFQRDIPVQTVRYYLKRYPFSDLPMQTATFQGNPPPFVRDKDGYYRVEMTNVPALRQEPQMPPEDQVRTWMLVYYPLDPKKNAMSYWKEYGKSLYERYKEEMRLNDDIRQAAAEAIGDAQLSEQKLERLFNYCRSEIKNISDDGSDLTADQLQKMKENKSPANTLKRGYGTRADINFLFAAMVMAAGFDARYAALSDRSRKFFDPDFADRYFINTDIIAVKVGEQWRFFEPGNTYVPFGRLRWEKEGVQVLIADPNEPIFVQTPLAAPEISRKKRLARLRLDGEGTLEGEVRIEYTGHFAIEMKEELDGLTPDLCEKRLRDSVNERLKTAQLSGIKIEGTADPAKPLVYYYKVRVPGYAILNDEDQLLLQPAFFQKSVARLFPERVRQNDIYFHYLWTEEDRVTIDLPRGFTVEESDPPGSLDFGQSGNYYVSLVMTKDQPAVVYQRNLTFKGLRFQRTSYRILKMVFDVIHQQDNHTLILKPEETGRVGE
jgi:Domain of Unknown Function with PDB structure (DUF3857)